MASTLTLHIRPLWDDIEPMRQQVLAFLLAQDMSSDTADAVAMVASELTENATKYGLAAGEEDRIEVTLSMGERSVAVEVKCRVPPREVENLRRLDRMIQWLRGFQDPFEAYVERLNQVSSEGLDSKESGLGLARIAYEGQSILDFYVDSGDVLAVSAVHQLPPAGGQGHGR